MTPHPIDQLTVTEPLILQNLSIFPLLLSKVTGPSYIPSSTAIEQHGLLVTEISEGGSVPNLLVENPSAHRVLLLDGEELHGAKQNRIINTTLLLPPRSKTIIPVSCTESGRWSYATPTFSSAKTVMPVKARRRKTLSVSHSLKSYHTFQSDQSEVWQEVDSISSKVGSHSPTSALSDAYATVRKDLEDAVGKLPSRDGQAGLIALIDGKPAGMDLLSRPEVYAELHAQILQSYAMEALAMERERLFRKQPAEGKKEEPATPDPMVAKTFLEQCAAIKGESFDSAALGKDWRFLKESIVGSGLEVEDTWIHMAYFKDEQEADKAGPRRHMSRMSRRARYRRPGEDIF